MNTITNNASSKSGIIRIGQIIANIAIIVNNNLLFFRDIRLVEI